MKKKSSPRKSLQTSGPTETELARLGALWDELFSLLPSEVVEGAYRSAQTSISVFLTRIGKGWATQHQAFAKDGIDYTDIGLQLVETGMYFMMLRCLPEGIGTYLEANARQNKQELSVYTQFASIIAKTEVPLFRLFKAASRQGAECLAGRPHLATRARQELERYFQIPEGTKSLDPDSEKSLHKQPMFVALLDELYVDLKKKRGDKAQPTPVRPMGLIRHSSVPQGPRFLIIQAATETSPRKAVITSG